MNQKLIEAKLLLLEVIVEKSQILPFGFGEQYGNEGFPKWSIYIDRNNKFYSYNSSIDDAQSIQENLSKLPLNILASLAENGINGLDFYEKINKSIDFQYSMCREATEDAKNFQKDNIGSIKNKK